MAREQLRSQKVLNQKKIMGTALPLHTASDFRLFPFKMKKIDGHGAVAPCSCLLLLLCSRGYKWQVTQVATFSLTSGL